MTNGNLHYIIELALFSFITYTVGCFLGASIRKLFDADEMKYANADSRYATVVDPADAATAAKTQATTPAMALQQHVPVDESPAQRSMKPPGLYEPRGGNADQLTRIKGIGPQNEKILKTLGIYHFDQIAAWNDEEVRWVEEHMEFDGRIEREKWIKQADLLANGNEEEFERLFGAPRLPGARKGKSATNKEREVAESVVPKMVRPASLEAAREGKPDDLKRISGMGIRSEKILHSLGYFHYDQIASWTPEQVAWIDDHLKFDGRVRREDWVNQARLLADGEEQEFVRLYGAGESRQAKGPNKPRGITQARGGKADDLQRISGIGPKNEKILHSLGIYHFDQMAGWTPDEIEWVDSRLNFNGRILREEWPRQAKLLADGNEEKFVAQYGSGGLKNKKGETKSGSRTRKS
jgi:predicted flap endonuclease-1-like 5' DNA nuclease